MRKHASEFQHVFRLNALAECTQVETMVEDSAKPRKFSVVIKWAAKVDVGAIMDFIE